MVALGMAMTVTQIATATAVLGWMAAEWIVHRKPTLLGMATGAIAGLVAITPAAGFVDPMAFAVDRPCLGRDLLHRLHQRQARHRL